MFEHFTDKAIKSVMLAQEEARRMRQNLVGSEQILLGLVGEGTSTAARLLAEQSVTLKVGRQAVEESIGRGSFGSSANIPFTPKAKRVFEQALQIARQHEHKHISPEHLLYALITEESVAVKVLGKLSVDLEQLQENLQAFFETDSSVKSEAATVGGRPTRSAFGSNSRSPRGSLAEFGTDLTQKAAEDRLDPIIGRDKEVERAIQILGRRTKNNPILVGEPGVGKTAIAEGLAQRIVRNDVPEALRDRRVIGLDMAALVAGTRFRGEFEERLKAIVSEVREAGNIILVIDEIHTLIGGGVMDGGLDAANLLKPALARGELQCLGTTTLDEYRKYIEQDAALERRFQRILIDEPTVDETIEILQGLRAPYEEFHKVRIAESAMEAAAKLSDRYIADRFLPDKAIDLIDEAGSRLHLRQSMERKQATIGGEPSGDRLDDNTSCEYPVVSSEDIAQIVASWTGVPVSKLTETESELLLHLEESLHQRVIGQDEAVTAVARAVRRARAGIKDPNRPIASFIFCGPTGVGKTELSKALAAYMFGDEAAMVRLDMSEYMDRYSVSKLIGSPPGFVGYDEGGQLTEAVRRRPYTVVLFDEIEKAHPDIFNLLLQVLDDGHLTDAHGRSVDFNNTVLILTSNLGSKAIEKGGGGLGFELATDADSARYQRIRDRVNEELKNTFRPEFINRLDEVVVFRQLLRDELARIADLILEDIRTRLHEQQDIGLEVTAAFKARAIEVGFDPAYGARPLRRALTHMLEDRLAEAILADALRAGNIAVADIAADGDILIAAREQKELVLQASR
ncbi:ATPase with chaperone activity, ATP-binding subunit [Rubidibacter lacunae KORDI 51-2]|uniref:ATPase with chaperone activity, ATP-binding subunit n=1 Tax=Rubidibacter lacunae KORDI 51-2 TaxID=582515 RepID=U5D658_9CHRO|nr:ATP-dependent Clp protease ATP-binding subunit [Rubidibacter lacunae]ERN40113.1 ATPase with chaperone activity, ATP-binding subunit [Rubidibacter lacunae KORDI 51-2]